MSLQLKFNARISCCKQNQLFVTDTTYKHNDNNNGWGCPNIEINDVVEAKIIVNEDSEYDILSQLQNQIVIDNEFTYDAINLTNYEDGVFKIQYFVRTSTQTFSNTIYIISLCNSRKCIDNLFVNAIKNHNKCCKEDPFKQAQFAENIYNSIISAGACYDIDVLNKLIAELKIICKPC